MNALAMEFQDDSFDLVWACESGEHMPDKKAYVEEMTRVLKPGVPRPANLPLRARKPTLIKPCCCAFARNCIALTPGVYSSCALM
jgi:ubiquinone/menaquinone biosynthesis C-methylase UbiE